MRVRRESGDFAIVVNADNEYKTKINKFLSAVDMIGQIVEMDGEQFMVTSAKDSNDKTTTAVPVGNANFVYTRATGAFEKVLVEG